MPTTAIMPSSPTPPASSSPRVGLLGMIAVVGTFYLLGCVGARTVDTRFSVIQLARSFVHSLVPIALVYVGAHYLTFLLFQGQAIGYLASDPAGLGWNLFGTADAGIDYGLIGATVTWYAQVAFVVAGHVGALTLAHDRALALYASIQYCDRVASWGLA